MIPLFPLSLLSARRAAVCVTALIGLAGLAAVSSVQADVPTVVAGDTYHIELEAYTSANPSDNFYVITPTIIPTFGTTKTYTNKTLVDGQVLTISSNETVSGNTFTDTISISVPDTFFPAGTTDSNNDVFDSLEFSIGNYNLPNGATENALNYTSALSNLTITGTATDMMGVVPVPSSLQNPLIGKMGTAFSDLYALTTEDHTDIGLRGFNSFTLTITNAVPEPSPVGAVLLGVGGLIGLTVVRRRRRGA